MKLLLFYFDALNHIGYLSIVEGHVTGISFTRDIKKINSEIIFILILLKSILFTFTHSQTKCGS